MKILEHNISGKVRVLMRREHILKICCNHYITSEMELVPLTGSNTSWTWTTLSDFSDEEAKVEKLCIRFKLFEVAQNFKTAFTDCLQKVKITKQSTVEQSDDLSLKFSLKDGSWECNDCSVINEEHATQCVACGSINPNSTVTTSTVSSVSSSLLQGLGSNFASLSTSSGAPSFGNFKFDSSTLSVNQPASVPLVNVVQSTTVTTDDDVESDHSSYDDGDDDQEEEDSDIDAEVVVSSEAVTSKFVARFAHKPGDWECGSCFVINEKDAMELSDSNQFEQLVCDHIATTVPCSPRSPEILPLSPSSSCSASSSRGRGRPMIDAMKN